MRAESQPEPRGTLAPRDRDRITVLVVDDEESYREALAVGLSRDGFSVEMAASAGEALRLFEHPPDVVLLDVMLPGISGIRAGGLPSR